MFSFVFALWLAASRQDLKELKMRYTPETSILYLACMRVPYCLGDYNFLHYSSMGCSFSPPPFLVVFLYGLY